jgi:hypothetical protein
VKISNLTQFLVHFSFGNCTALHIRIAVTAAAAAAADARHSQTVLYAVNVK